MTDSLMNKLQELDCRVSSNFPLKPKMLEYLRTMKDENVMGSSREYMDMAYDISAMCFRDTLKFLPILLHVEISRMMASGFCGCAECVVFWVCDSSQQELQSLTLAQLEVIKDWIELFAANAYVDERRIKDAVDGIQAVINTKSA